MMNKLPVGFSRRDNGTLQYRFSIEGRRYTVHGSTIKECRDKEALKRLELEAQNVTKVRITAKDEQDAKKAVEALAAAWKHHSIKQIIPADQLNKKQPDYVAYCVKLWN